MTPEEAIVHVEESIAKALRGESYLDPSVLEIKGFSTATQRHLVRNLCQPPVRNYLEVGLYFGGTFCAAISNNLELEAIGYENLSQSFGESEVFEKLSRNLAAHSGITGNIGRIQVIYRDCFKPDRRDWGMGPMVDFFYYDGEHSVESQAKALPHFIDRMDQTFIFMIDDYCWPTVHQGTYNGFQALVGRIKKHAIWWLTDGKPDGPRWHNDVGIWVIEKV